MFNLFKFFILILIIILSLDLHATSDSYYTKLRSTCITAYNTGRGNQCVGEFKKLQQRLGEYKMKLRTLNAQLVGQQQKKGVLDTQYDSSQNAQLNSNTAQLLNSSIIPQITECNQFGARVASEITNIKQGCTVASCQTLERDLNQSQFQAACQQELVEARASTASFVDTSRHIANFEQSDGEDESNGVSLEDEKSSDDKLEKTDDSVADDADSDSKKKAAAPANPMQQMMMMQMMSGGGGMFGQQQQGQQEQSNSQDNSALDFSPDESPESVAKCVKESKVSKACRKMFCKLSPSKIKAADNADPKEKEAIDKLRRDFAVAAKSVKCEAS